MEIYKSNDNHIYPRYKGNKKKSEPFESLKIIEKEQ